MDQKKQTVLDVKFYQLESGKEPVREWLKEEIIPEDCKSIGEDIKTVQFGWPLGMPIVRKLEAALWEVRSIISVGKARIIFTISGRNMILLHGFIKKSDTTPQEDLKTARVRKRHILKERKI